MTRDRGVLSLVWREVEVAAQRGGFATVGALIEMRYGLVPREGDGHDAGDRDKERGGEKDWRRAALPAPEELIERLAERHGLDTLGIDVRPGETSRTFTVAPGMACGTYARGDDELATLALAMHEAGHALFRAHLNAAAEPPRWLDEAAAAWAVRALEDPSLIPDAAVGAEAARRRLRREAITARLAAFEAAVIAGARVEDAWPADLDPAAYPALFDEPGVMAAYAAADRWPRRVLPRKVRP